MPNKLWGTGQAPNGQEQRDAKALDALFRAISGHEPKMWGESIVGYGVYHYRYASGREGDSFRLGFSPRKQSMSVYLMSGFEDHAELLEQLGKYKLGKSCLSVKRLSEVDLSVLTELARRAWDEMRRRYPE
ncbi:MAG: DUF1801 domain-containing protein [Myxococcota bacterium]|jgi:hypothetical protein|nr:DUF1801 domain-containing protein [Myxococcota bacterium]